MNDIVQTIAAALLVTAALTYLAVRVRRALEMARARKTQGCGSHCGCD